MLHSGWGFGLAKVLSFNGYFLQVPLTACRRIVNKHFLTACVFASLQELKSWCHKTHGGDTLETPSCSAQLLGFSLRRNCMAMTWFWDQSPAQRMGWAHFAGCVRSRIRNHFLTAGGTFFLGVFFLVRVTDSRAWRSKCRTCSFRRAMQGFPTSNGVEIKPTRCKYSNTYEKRVDLTFSQLNL